MYFEKFKRCQNCNEEIEIDIHDETSIVLCPKCCAKVYTHMEQHLTFPIGYYLGYRRVAEIVRIDNNLNEKYILKRDGEEDILLEFTKFSDEIGKAGLNLVLKWLLGN